MLNKAVLISIRSEWCNLIANGVKTVEVRKTKPTLKAPFKVYIYCSLPQSSGDIYLCGSVKPVQGNGRIIGEFICSEVAKIDKDSHDFIYKGSFGCVYKDYAENNLGLFSCINDKALLDYLNHRQGYAWIITDLKLYDSPQSLNSFHQISDGCSMKRPPQSWCYVKEKAI